MIALTRPQRLVRGDLRRHRPRALVTRCHRACGGRRNGGTDRVGSARTDAAIDASLTAYAPKPGVSAVDAPLILPKGGGPRLRG